MLVDTIMIHFNGAACPDKIDTRINVKVYVVDKWMITAHYELKFIQRLKSERNIWKLLSLSVRN